MDYKPKNILITGGCGFIGSNFINYMLNLPKSLETFERENNGSNIGLVFKSAYRIVNIDAMNYCSSCNNIDVPEEEKEKYVFVKGNTSSYDLVYNVLKTYDIDTVINFAAQSHVDNSFNNSLIFTNDNILGTHTLLEACRAKGDSIKRFIHVSTDEVYGESQLNEEKKTEQSVLCPTNPYAATKAGAELIVMSYYHSYGMPIIITRGNNVYGPRQYPEKLIPKFINLIKNKQPLTIQGSGDALRSFIYVEDVSTAFFTIMNKGEIGVIYNIGADDESEFSVLDITKMLLNMMSPPGYDGSIDKFITFIKDRDFNDKRYFISNEKLLNLGWKPKYNIHDGLKKTIEWYNNIDSSSYW